MTKFRLHRFGLVLLLVAILWIGTEAPIPWWVICVMASVGSAMYVGADD